MPNYGLEILAGLLGGIGGLGQVVGASRQRELEERKVQAEELYRQAQMQHLQAQAAQEQEKLAFEREKLQQTAEIEATKRLRDTVRVPWGALPSSMQPYFQPDARGMVEFIRGDETHKALMAERAKENERIAQREQSQAAAAALQSLLSGGAPTAQRQPMFPVTDIEAAGGVVSPLAEPAGPSGRGPRREIEPLIALLTSGMAPEAAGKLFEAAYPKERQPIKVTGINPVTGAQETILTTPAGEKIASFQSGLPLADQIRLIKKALAEEEAAPPVGPPQPIQPPSPTGALTPGAPPPRGAAPDVGMPGAGAPGTTLGGIGGPARQPGMRPTIGVKLGDVNVTYGPEPEPTTSEAHVAIRKYNKRLSELNPDEMGVVMEETLQQRIRERVREKSAELALQPLTDSDKQAIQNATQMDTVMSIWRQFRFTPDELQQYAGYLRRPWQDVKLFVQDMLGQNTDQRFIAFRTMMGHFKSQAFQAGGKQLTPFEASVVMLFTPHGRETGGGKEVDFKIRMLEATLRNGLQTRLELAREARGFLDPATLSERIRQRVVLEGLPEGFLPSATGESPRQLLTPQQPGTPAPKGGQPRPGGGIRIVP